jgi:hypothetical protein
MKTEKTNIIHLPILIEQDEDRIYIVSCPVFKGCHSYGKTVDEALQNIREVIALQYQCIEMKICQKDCSEKLFAKTLN